MVQRMAPHRRLRPTTAAGIPATGRASAARQLDQDGDRLVWRAVVEVVARRQFVIAPARVRLDTRRARRLWPGRVLAPGAVDIGARQRRLTPLQAQRLGEGQQRLRPAARRRPGDNLRRVVGLASLGSLGGLAVYDKDPNLAAGILGVGVAAAVTGVVLAAIGRNQKNVANGHAVDAMNYYNDEVGSYGGTCKRPAAPLPEVQAAPRPATPEPAPSRTQPDPVDENGRASPPPPPPPPPPPTQVPDQI